MLYVVITERIDPLLTFIDVCFYKTILGFLISSSTIFFGVASVLISFFLSIKGFKVLFLGVKALQVNDFPNELTLCKNDYFGRVLSVTILEILKF